MKKSKIFVLSFLFLIVFAHNAMAVSYEAVENYIETCTNRLEGLYDILSLTSSQENLLKNDINSFIQSSNADLTAQESKYGEDSTKFTTKDIKTNCDKIYNKWTNKNTNETTIASGEKKKITIKGGEAAGKIKVVSEEKTNANVNPNQVSYGVAGGSNNTIETAVTNGVLTQSGNSFVYLINGVKLCNGYAKLDIDSNGIPEYYYFDNDGNLLVNGKTPESYTTNEIGQCINSFGIKIGEANPNAIKTESKVLTKTMADLPSSITNLISSSKEPLDRAFFRGKLREIEWDPDEVENLIELVDWKKEAVKFLEKLYVKHSNYSDEKIKERMTQVEFTRSEIQHAFNNAEKPDTDDDDEDDD